jgi:hypothetical protein
MADRLPAGIQARPRLPPRTTLGGAVAAAGQLSDKLGQALLRTARVAFTHCLHLAFAVGAAAAIGVAVLAAVQLRRLPPDSEPQTQADDRSAPPRPPPRAMGALLSVSVQMVRGVGFASRWVGLASATIRGPDGSCGRTERRARK